MKRIAFIFLAVLMSTTVCSAAMSNSKVRKETRFLTDKMAYELNLNTEQYNDVYEINYDFISGIRYLMDDVLYGEEWALNRYYDYLDARNDDLRWVLDSRQYNRFMQATYFYRPVYVSTGHWSFRVYTTYTNHNHFYFPRPYHYRTYCGGHDRTHHQHASYYRGRYNHQAYTGSYRIRDDKSYHTSRRSDFGSVNIRPNSNVRPTGNTSTTRRNNNADNNRGKTNSYSRPANENSSSRRSSSSSNTNNNGSSSSRIGDSNGSRQTGTDNTKVRDDNSSSRHSNRVSTESKDKNSPATSRDSESSNSRRNSSSSNNSGNSSRTGESNSSRQTGADNTKARDNSSSRRSSRVSTESKDKTNSSKTRTSESNSRSSRSSR